VSESEISRDASSLLSTESPSIEGMGGGGTSGGGGLAVGAAGHRRKYASVEGWGGQPAAVPGSAAP
jgi:hypothetical protein